MLRSIILYIVLYYIIAPAAGFPSSVSLSVLSALSAMVVRPGCPPCFFALVFRPGCPPWLSALNP
jgi:hypothetical protein